jgi:hypothetical protein
MSGIVDDNAVSWLLPNAVHRHPAGPVTPPKILFSINRPILFYVIGAYLLEIPLELLETPTGQFLSACKFGQQVIYRFNLI